ncbi:MAG: VOC family protein [Candidatus Diapherotrites archaeon]|uniref:VOC family protein n=1 Tax=Candidatus Iainarchaeum sp. TaxID=3101447 RepID=A0A8T3YRQ8_9ARCH|nr:VOC family protein [Candidatus Diapherotrites archaeon]
MDKVVHFEIPADDMERGKAFYEKVFGWKIDKVPNMDYHMAITGKVDKNGRGAEMNAINGGMMMRDESAPYPQVVMNVENIDETLKKVRANGGEALTPVIPVGDFGKLCRIKDSEGNVVSVWQDVKKT